MRLCLIRAKTGQPVLFSHGASELPCVWSLVAGERAARCWNEVSVVWMENTVWPRGHVTVNDRVGQIFVPEWVEEKGGA